MTESGLSAVEMDAVLAYATELAEAAPPLSDEQVTLLRNIFAEPNDPGHVVEMTRAVLRGVETG